MKANRVVYGRKAVESGAREARTEMNHSLDQYFDVRQVNLKEKPKKLEDDDIDKWTDNVDEDGHHDIVRPVVVCKDVKEFIYHIMMERNLDPEDTVVKIGADDGQKIFKLNVQLLKRSQDVEDDKYSEGVAPKQHKDGSVNKLFILLAVPQVQELYINLQLMLQELNLELMDFIITSDIRMILILLGKDQASCRHCCPYCEGRAPWDVTSPLNTLGSLCNWHELWLADGSKNSRSKMFQNMRHQPLISGNPEDLIIKLFAPMELHLMLGVVDKLIGEIKKNVFENQSDGEKFMYTFFKQDNITVCNKQGEKLEGNASRKFLKSIDKLELALGNHSNNVYINGMPFIRCLRAFSNVVHTTFGMELLEGWRESIGEFTTSYRFLIKTSGDPITVTPKVHIIMEHVGQYLDMKGEHGEYKGLGFWSEQAFESVHADFKKSWESVKVDISHPDFPKKLKNCVTRYNSSHI